ncbi:hypothetical protein [uncultured Methanobrevibacter sp.]|uniref:hypothetical protein n=1 Tax=uncultured Methanobrevibacter sp. TaxID=253161 RepID=UPI0025F40E67|nr:hypothetical protein [uncultured Methanobrevibacter sp.]
MASILNRKYWERKSLIEKQQNQLSAYYIQVYNNNIIDQYVEDYINDKPAAKPTQAMLYGDLYVLNKPTVYKQYNKIINSKYTSNSALQHMFIKNKANSRLNTIVETELDRITKNLNYTEKVLGKYELNLKEYQKIAKREKKIANRKNIMEKSVKDVDFIRSKFGINIPSNDFNYRDLTPTAEAMNRQTQMDASWEECDAINQEAREKGLSDVYTQKEWIWTNEGQTTRHSANDGQIVDFYEPFQCMHDVTGEIEPLMYPCDPNGSFENTWICYCQFRAF